MSIPIPSENGTCLITGASAGIGKEFAFQMAERGYSVTLVARRVKRLNEIAARIERKYNTRVAVHECDVTDPEQRRELLEAIEARGDVVDILINNAGIGTDGPFWERHTDEQLAQIDINVTALTALTHMVLPGMIERGHGAVLNVASTAAFQPLPRQSVYAATKAYVLSFSQAMSKELAGTGVSMTVLCPGPTRTEFFGERQAKIEESSPGFTWQSAEDCARDGIDGMFKKKRVVVPKPLNKIGAVSGRYAPTKVTLEVLDRFWPVGK